MLTQRTPLSAGVIIAVALIPALCIAAMAVLTGEFGLALRLSDAVSVLVGSGLVLAVKHHLHHRREPLT